MKIALHSRLFDNSIPYKYNQVRIICLKGVLFMSSEHRSTARVLDILSIIAASEGGYTLTQLARLLDAPKSSLHPILATMRVRRFITLGRDTQLYRIGPAAFQVGMSYINRTSILGVVETEVEKIVAKTLETCHFSVLDSQGNVVYLLKKDSPQLVRMQSTVGQIMPAYGTGIGKALLIDKSLKELTELYPEGLHPLTENTIVDFDRLFGEISSFRGDDISYENEESNEEICCVGAALRRHGQVIAALSVAVPKFRFGPEKAERIRAVLLESKAKLEPFFEETEVDFGL